ncbi:MAG: ribosome-binding factor [Chloroflexota bacterium]|nr:ribosome-binding factor [Chloroflexota bacterium]
MPHRVDKVAAQLQEEISAVLRTLDDPRVGMASVVEVEVTPDLRFARVRVSALGGDDEHDALMTALGKARGHIRHELAARLRNNLRRVPELTFVDDRNIEYAVHIGALIESLKEGQDEG